MRKDNLYFRRAEIQGVSIPLRGFKDLEDLEGFDEKGLYYKEPRKREL